MKSKSFLTKVLTLIGLFFVWIPIIFPVIISVIKLIVSGRFRFDFLMPAEMFPIIFIGATILLWSSKRTGYYKKHIGLGLLSAVVFLVGAQGLAVLTGLASGAIELKGWPFVLVIATIIIYNFAVIEIGVVGLYLIKKINSDYIGSFKSNRF